MKRGIIGLAAVSAVMLVGIQASYGAAVQNPVSAVGSSGSTNVSPNSAAAVGALLAGAGVFMQGLAAISVVISTGCGKSPDVTPQQQPSMQVALGR